jgi:hypothetical protein
MQIVLLLFIIILFLILANPRFNLTISRIVGVPLLSTFLNTFKPKNQAKSKIYLHFMHI